MGLTLRPSSVEEVGDAVAELRRSRRAALVVGGGTMVDVANPVPFDVRLSTLGLQGVSYHEPADLIVSVAAGTTLAECNARLASAEQVLPVWHPAPGTATIGGLVAFGWTGLGRHLYGRLRDRVLEVRVVTGEGKAVRGGAKVVKNVTGFDLPRLFFGSMGTLGVVCEVTLKVHPRPAPLYGAAGGGEPGELVRALRAGVHRAGQPVEAVLVRGERGWRSYAFAPGPEADATTLLSAFGGLSATGPADEEFARAARDVVLCPGPGEGAGFRASVPSSRVIGLVERLEGASRAVVDVAGGTAWVGAHDAGAIPGLRRFAEDAGGSLVLLRAPEDVRREAGVWGSPPASVELMRRLKTQFDPDDVLGRGRFVL